jgi:hypothetical protein
MLRAEIARSIRAIDFKPIIVGIPTIATTRYDGSRPPIPIDRDQA